MYDFIKFRILIARMVEKLDSKFKDFLYFIYRWVSQIIIIKPMLIVRLFTLYLHDLIKYKFMNKSLKRYEKIRLLDTYPVLGEKTAVTKFDPHYFYQSAWASGKIYSSSTKEHIDVGSQINLIADISAFTHVTFIDIRPLNITINNISSKKGSILKMPYKNNSVRSLSCLHVAEHIGLGRYGDSLDPEGTKKACKELSRILAIGGNLYFSLPIGRPRVCFNAHRIHSPEQILSYFDNLTLVSVSAVDDKKRFIEKGNLKDMASYYYGCDMFHFTKK